MHNHETKGVVQETDNMDLESDLCEESPGSSVMPIPLSRMSNTGHLLLEIIYTVE